MRRKLLRHIFFSNIDTGILMVYLPLYVWRVTGELSFVVTSVIIPLIMNVFFDAYFSRLGDKFNRKLLIVSGVVMSGVFLVFLGYIDDIRIFLLVLGLRSLAEVLYMTNMAPVLRNAVEVHGYQEFMIRKNQIITIASVVGGGIFYIFAGYINDYSLLFVLTGVIEILSVASIANMDINSMVRVSKLKRHQLAVIFRYRELVMAMAFGFANATMYSRLMVYGFQMLHFDDLDLAEVFVIVFVSSTFILHYFRRMIYSKGNTRAFAASLVLMAAAVISISFELNYTPFVIAWILVELFEAISYSAINDSYNKKLADRDGVESSYYRISASIGTILGAVFITSIAEMFGMMVSFRVTAVMFLVFGALVITGRYALE